MNRHRWFDHAFKKASRFLSAQRVSALSVIFCLAGSVAAAPSEDVAAGAAGGIWIGWAVVLLAAIVVMATAIVWLMVTGGRLGRGSGKLTQWQMQRFYEQAPMCYQSLDDNGCFATINEAWLNELKLTREEVIGKSFGDLLDAEERELFRKRFAKFKETGIAKAVEFHLKRKDGSIMHAVIDGWADYDENGQFKRTHCILQHAVDHSATQQALRDSESRFREMADHIQDIFWLANVQPYEMLYISPAYDQVMGRSRVSFYENERTFYDAVVDAERQAVRTHFHESERKASETSLEFRINHGDGSVRWLLSRIYPIFDDTGKMIRQCGTIKDITDRKQIEQQLLQANTELEKRAELKTEQLAAANDDLHRQIVVRQQTEDALRDTETRFRRVFDELPSGLVITAAANDEIISVNRAFCRIIGRERSDLVGRTTSDLVHEDDRQVGREQAQRLAAGEIGHYTTEKRLTASDGRIIWAKINTFSLVETEDDRAEYLVSMFEDVSRLRQALDSARRNERLASIGTLAAGISHEINNPLGSIVMAAHLAKMSPAGEDETAREMLDLIVADTRRCSKIVKSVLQFARDNQFDKEPTDVLAIARRTCDSLSEELAASETEIVLNSKTDMPLMTVNPDGIEQAMGHILRNAIDAGAGRVEMKLRADETERMLRISVRDDGQGMSEDQLKHAFDPFFSDKPRENSSGLGLSITHGIVVAHGGSIDIMLNEDKGVTVEIDIPFNKNPQYSKVNDES